MKFPLKQQRSYLHKFIAISVSCFFILFNIFSYASPVYAARPQSFFEQALISSSASSLGGISQLDIKKIETVFSSIKENAASIIEGFLSDPQKIMLEIKADEGVKGDTPVTPVDKAVERFIRELIESQFEPGSVNVIGEEEDSSFDPNNDITFVVDPIDGTPPFLLYLLYRLRLEPHKAPELAEKLEQDFADGTFRTHGAEVEQVDQRGLFGIAFSVLYKGTPVRSLLYAPMYKALSEKGLIVEGKSYSEKSVSVNGKEIPLNLEQGVEEMKLSFPSHRLLVPKLTNLLALFSGKVKEAPSAALVQSLLAIQSLEEVQKHKFASNIFLFPHSYANIWDVILGIHFVRLMGGAAYDIYGSDITQLNLPEIKAKNQGEFKLPTIILSPKSEKARILKALQSDIVRLEKEDPIFLEEVLGVTEKISAKSLGKGVSSSDASVYVLDDLEIPVNVFVHREDIKFFSPEQLDEIFKLAGRNLGQLQVVVTHSGSYDKHPLLNLPNIYFTPQSAKEAAKGIRRAKYNLHLSRTIEPSEDFTLVGDNKFRYPNDENGLLGVALLYTQSQNPLAFLTKYGLRKVDGFFSVVQATLLALVQSHEADLAIARAA